MGWIEAYQRDGYAVIERALDPKLIHAHVRRYGAFLDAEDAGEAAQAGWSRERERAFYAASAAFHASEGALQLAMAPAVRDAVRALFGDEPVLMDARTNFWSKGDLAPHVDDAYYVTDPAEHFCCSWAALEDIDPASGVFFLLPGSHALTGSAVRDAVVEAQPEALQVLSPERPGRQEVAAWRRHVWQPLAARVQALAEGRERLTFAPRRGDVILFRPDIIHGTMPRQDPIARRLMLICQWRARRSRLYTPFEWFGSRHDRRDPARNGALAGAGAMRSEWGMHALV